MTQTKAKRLGIFAWDNAILTQRINRRFTLNGIKKLAACPAGGRKRLQIRRNLPHDERCIQQEKNDGIHRAHCIRCIVSI